jgi:hypothetical protein
MPEHADFFPADLDYDALAAECVKMLPRGLDQLEIMLQHGKFLQNADEVSIADVSLVCELTQLQVGYICTKLIDLHTTAILGCTDRSKDATHVFY